MKAVTDLDNMPMPMYLNAGIFQVSLVSVYVTAL